MCQFEQFCHSGRNQSMFPDLQVVAFVSAGDAGGGPLHVPIFTSYKHFSRRWEWNQWLRLPVKYSDLPRYATLNLEIFDCEGPGKRHCVGATTLPLFGAKTGEFRQGQIDLRVWSGMRADGRAARSATPGEAVLSGQENVER